MPSGPIHLTLMIGPMVPVPVPRAVIEALSSVTIRSSARDPSGFELVFDYSNESVLDTIVLLSGRIGPIVRTVITVMVEGVPHVLMDGLITDVQTSPGSGSGKSTLTITGQDLSKAMDQTDLRGIPYPAMPASARVLLILAKYAGFGVIPKVIPSLIPDVPSPVDQIPSHVGTDLAYINRLADEVGYVFYIDPGPVPGTSKAYWGPELKVGIPQPALSVNMDAHTNVEQINFRHDGRSSKLPIVTIQNEETRTPIPIPIPDINPLNPPLGKIPPIPLDVEPLKDAAKLRPVQAAVRGLAERARSAEAVTAAGSLDVLRYGHVLKARSLVGVRGAGTAFDGLYFVDSVTHTIRRGEYKQQFGLSRSGLMSTVTTVPV